VIQYLAQGGGDGYNIHLPIPGVPDITPEQIGGALALLLVTLFLIKGWKVISAHPVLLIVLVLIGFAAVGLITLHVPGSKLH
jgi:hypothetical protein